MSYEMRLDDGSEESKDWVWFFGSAGAVSAFTDWIKTLPEQFVKLHEFARELRVKNTMDFDVDLSIAAEAFPPPDGVLAMIEEMRKHIDEGDEDETLIVAEDVDDEG